MQFFDCPKNDCPKNDCPKNDRLKNDRVHPKNDPPESEQLGRDCLRQLHPKNVRRKTPHPKDVRSKSVRSQNVRLRDSCTSLLQLLYFSADRAPRATLAPAVCGREAK